MKYPVYILLAILLWGFWALFSKLACGYMPASSVLLFEILAAMPLAVIVFSVSRPPILLKNPGTWFALVATPPVD